MNKEVKQLMKLAAVAGLTNLGNSVVRTVTPLVKKSIEQKICYKIQVDDMFWLEPYNNTCKVLHELFPNLNKFYKPNRYLDESKSTSSDNNIPSNLHFTGWHNKCLYTISNIPFDASDSRNHIINISICGVNAKQEFEYITNYINKGGESVNKLDVRQYSENGSFYQYEYDKYSMNNIFSDKKEQIIDILEKFKKDDFIYKKHQIKHNIGILLYGEPGTGKSSFAKAIASYMGYRLVIIKVNYINDNLINNISRMTNSVILFEDIDCSTGTRSDKDDNKKDKQYNPFDNYMKSMKYDTIGDLLNVLDGINSPNNCIFIGTTNYKDKLDDAILRNGRFDYHIEIGKINKETASGMCNNYGVNIDNVVNMRGDELINPSTLQFKILEVLKTRL